MDSYFPQLHHGDQAVPCIDVGRDAGVFNKFAERMKLHKLDPTLQDKAGVAAHLYVPICPHSYHRAHLSHTLSEYCQLSC